MVMRALASDLRDEGNELYEYLATLSDPDWTRPTPFKSWTAEDVLTHLTVGDWLNMLSMTDPQKFDVVMAKREDARAQGRKGSGAEYFDESLGSGNRLLAQWHARFNQLCDLFHDADAKARMKWAGPDMSIRSAATARLMETWAHGQDVYDMAHVDRAATDRIRHIAVLGVNTFGWTFANRGIEAPRPVPFVELTAPSGKIWCWNDESEENKISGPALDFCQVVTQGRNIAEVGLQVVGEPATKWMAIAQCFAGPVEDPPAPGTRTGPHPLKEEYHGQATNSRA